MSRERRWTTEEHGGSGVDPARILPDLACECSSRGTRGMERDEGKRRVRGEGERKMAGWGGGGGGKPRRRINRSGFQARACESGDQWSREGNFDESGRPWAKRGRGHGGGGGVCDAQGRLRAHPKLSSLPCFLFFFLISSFPPPLFFSSRYSSIGSLSLLSVRFNN